MTRKDIEKLIKKFPYNEETGGLLNEEQKKVLLKEIKASYVTCSSESFVKDDIRQKIHNYANPVASKKVGSITFKVTRGLSRTSSTYLLYAGKSIIGKFFSVDSAKESVQQMVNSLKEEKKTNSFGV